MRNDVWVSPIRRTVPFAPVERVQPYAKIHEYREHPYPEERAAYDTADLASRFSRLAAASVAAATAVSADKANARKPLIELLREEAPADLAGYAAYGPDKQKTWRIPRQGLMYDTYG